MSLFLLLLTLAGPVSASTVIRGTLTLTNAANLTGTSALETIILTNGASTTTRIWTNSVASASTQILASTNSATAFSALVSHFQSYPMSGLQFFSNGSDAVTWQAAADTLLTITLGTNNWGSVSYVTNTVTSAVAVRVPYTVEATATRNSVSDGLMNWLNIAPTNKLNSLQLAWVHSAQTAHSAVTNFVADFAGNPYRSITAAANVNLVHSTNRPPSTTNVVSTTFFITASGANRTLTLNSSWVPTPSAITITNATTGVLTVAAKGTAETDVYWAFGYLGAGGGADTDDQTAAEVVFTPAGTIAAAQVQAALEELDTEKEPALTDSASLRTTLTDESGTGVALFAGGAIGAATATTPSVDDNDTSVATTAFVQAEITDNLNTSAEVATIVGDETGSGALVFGTSPTIATPTISGAIGFPDGVRQTFNPDGTTPGLNVGSHATDPASPSNGDIWYDSGNNLLRARVNGSTISITGSAGGLASTDIDTSAELRGILTDESGTGALLFAGGDIGAATATTPSALDNDTSVATTAYVQGEINFSKHLNPRSAILPASNPAVIDSGNERPRLLFDDSTAESASWVFVLEGWKGGTLVADVYFSMVSATANEVQFRGYLDARTPATDNDDFDTTSFDSANEGSATTVAATAGRIYKQTITLTNADSAAAGDLVVFKLDRDATDAVNDDATGDAEVRWIVVHE